MGNIYPEIDAELRAFIEAQQVFFVATAPLDPSGHVNASPKGLDTFRVIDPRSIAYLDYVGSGVETIAHLRENGRIVLMFCAFEGRPRIVRLHGHGQVLEPRDTGYEPLRTLFPNSTVVLARSIVRVSIQRIADSCGFGVPRYAYKGQRPQLLTWAERIGEQGLIEYQEAKNAVSIDGLRGLQWIDKD